MLIGRQAAQLLASTPDEWLTGTLAAQVLSISHPRAARSSNDLPEEAVQWAEQFGYPVALKIASPDIPHKSDIGGVALDLNEAGAVRAAFERIVINARRAAPARSKAPRSSRCCALDKR
jgi:acyl-CoA synthetase (NDP forming)